MHYIALTFKSAILGYYVADDADLSPSPIDARKWHDAHEARDAARRCTQQWNLQPGEEFVAFKPAKLGFSARV